MPARQAGPDDEVGACPADAVGKLTSQDALDLTVGHRAAGLQAPALDRGRGGHHQNQVAGAVAAGFEQKGHVEHRVGSARRAGAGEKAALPLPDHRVEDALERRQQGRIGGHGEAEAPAIDGAAHNGVGHDQRDRQNGGTSPPLQLVHSPIGVKDRDAGAAEAGGDGGFAHRDTAGEPDHTQARCAPEAAGTDATRPGSVKRGFEGPGPWRGSSSQVLGMSAAMRSRSTASISGSTPNQAVKPGRAW